MKTKRMLGVVLALVLVCAGFSPAKQVEAASYKTNIKKLVKQMRVAECSVLTYEDAPYADTVKVDLTTDRMARFAAVSLPFKESDGLTKGEFGGFVTYKFSDAKLKKASKNIFGKELSKKDVTTTENESWVCDAYKTKENGVVIYETDGETESSYSLIKISIKKSGSGYKVTKSIYWGYWGGDDGSRINYKIIYTVKKCSASAYGYKITGMTVKPVYIES